MKATPLSHPPTGLTVLKNHAKILATGIFAAVGISTGWAASLTWDPGLTIGVTPGGAGTWDLNTTANWYNGTADVIWGDSSSLGVNSAIFSGTAGVVGLNNSLSASNLQFLASGYTLNGTGSLTLGAGGIDASALATGVTTISNPLMIPGLQEAWLVGAGSSLAANGSITRAPGASIDFPAAGVTSSALANVNGILGAWATTGNSVSSTTTGDWAANDGAGNLITYTGYTLVGGVTNGNAAGISSQNWKNSAAGTVVTLTNSAVINSLVQQGDFSVADGATLTLGGGGLIEQGVSRWLLDNGGGNIGTATLLSGLPSGEFFIHNPNGAYANNGASGGNWRVWPAIKDNGATPAILIKDGPGCTILQNHNTYSGGTIINNGILIPSADTTVALQPTILGPGSVTINPQGTLEIGYGTANAVLDYSVTNSMILAGGKILAGDGHQHVAGPVMVTGGATFGSTYDGGGSATTGNKALFIDGVVSGTGPISLEQSVAAGDNDRYASGGGNAYNSSVVEFTNNASTFSGVITVIPYITGTGAGSYLADNATLALQFATINLANNTGGHRFAGSGTTYSSMIFNTGLGSATIGALTGSGDLILNGYNENTYALNADPIALSVGANNSSTTNLGTITGAGSLNKIGTGSLTLSGASTYAGDTSVSGGTLALPGGWVASTNINVAAGATLDVSTLGTVTLAGNQIFSSGGLLNGSLATSAGSKVYAGTDGGYGTNTVSGSLTIASGSTLYLDLGTLHNGSNDLFTVAGAVFANNNILHLKAPSTLASLDSSADYVLLTSPSTISGSFASAPAWDVAPVNAGHFSVVTGPNTVTLHYAAFTAPTGLGTATPAVAVRNQTLLLTVDATNGTGGAVTSVTVDTSSIGGSSAFALVAAGGNVWTNSIAVAAATPAGSTSLPATLTDSASLTAIVNLPLSVLPGNDVWNGLAADNNFSSNLNWTNRTAPGLVGDSLEFAGGTQLAPNMDNNYTVTGLTFDAGAGLFNLGSTVGGTLTLTGAGSIVNNSANPQTLNLTLTDTGAGMAKAGLGALVLPATENFLGPVRVRAGSLELSGSLTTSNLLIGDLSNSVAAVYQTAGSLSAANAGAYDNLSVGNLSGSYGYYDAAGGSATIAGMAVGGEDNSGNAANFGGAAGNGIMDINGGAVACTGWFVMARNANAQTAILNLYSGSLTYAGGGLVCNWGTGQTSIINVMGGSVSSPTAAIELGSAGNQGVLNLVGGLASATAVAGNFGGTYGQVNFNGGTLQAQVNTTAFLRVSTATVYAAGGIVDNNGWPIAISQPLLAPSGNGVSAVTSFTAGSGYIAPPIVTISPGAGDTTGKGATAIAQINPATGLVTAVIITCPGFNYTATPVFNFSGGGATTQAAVTGVTLAPNSSGGLTFTGTGATTTLSNLNTYTGATIISNTTVALDGSLLSTNIIVGPGGTLDVSGITYTLGAQALSGFGNVNGSVNTSAGSQIVGGTPGNYGTNTFNNNLTLVSGAACTLDLGLAYNGTNSQLAVSGVLTANGNYIHIAVPNSASNLDTTADYVLVTSPNAIVGAFATAPVWDVAPANAGHYSVVTSGSTVTLHYNAAASAPTVSATASPAVLVRNQPARITATVVPGSASISTVTLDLSSLGGSMVSLVQSNASDLYTNSVLIPASAAPGAANLTVTVTDSAAQSASATLALTINSSTEVWAGLAPSQNWSTNSDWVSGYAPGLGGDAVVFAGSTGLAPNLDGNYSITGLAFSNNAGSFTLASANGSVLTLTSGGIVNNSTSAQTINVPVTLTAAQAVNAASGGITLGGPVADSGAGLTTTGDNAVTLSGASTFTGPAAFNAATLNLSGSITPGATTLGSVSGVSVANLSGAITSQNLFVGNAAGAVAAVYQTAGTVSLSGGTGDLLNVGNVTGSYGYYDAIGGTMNINGISIGGESNPNVWPPAGSGDGILEVNGATINNLGWIVLARGGSPENGILNMYSGLLTFSGGGLSGNWQLSGTGQTSIINVMGGTLSSTNQGVFFRSVDTGILNLNGGVLQATAVGGAGTVNFNGGTLRTAITNAAFLTPNNAYVYGGGATLDNNGMSLGISQALLAPPGKGEPGILLLGGGAGYVAPPVIIITNAPGDTNGSGATAIAQINRLTGTVTNVIVTCPGVNYTATPIFLVSGGGATTPATITGAPIAANASGGLTCVGSGIVTLSGANTYTGNTTVSAGTLELVNPTLGTNASVSVASGALLRLDFSTTNTVAGLVLNGVSQPAGVYNSVNAAPYLVGSGSLLVASATAPAQASLAFSVSHGVLGISWPADHLGWILQQETNALNVGITSNGWVDLAGSSSVTSTNLTINKLTPASFYRLRHP